MALQTGLKVFLAIFCFISLLKFDAVRSAADDWKDERQADSSICVARRYCKAESAISALMTEKSLDRAEAEAITDYTHGSSRIKWNSCSCSATCTLSQNCCPDADALTRVFPDSIRSTSAECAYFEWKMVSVISSCPASLAAKLAPSIEDLCVNGGAGDSTFFKVTSPKTLVTYANIYCAMCHGERVGELLPWSFKLQCTDIPAPPSDNATSSIGEQTLEELGRANQCGKSTTAPQIPPSQLADTISTIVGAVIVDEPDSMCDKIDNVIDTCPQGASTTDITECTEGDTNYVTAISSVTESFNLINNSVSQPSLIYRNPACARCNSIQKDALTCQICNPVTDCKTGDEDNPPFITSFSILVQPYSYDNAEACRAEKDGGECRGELSSLPTCNIGEYLDRETVSCVPLCPAGSLLFRGICTTKDSMSTSNCNETVSYDSYVSKGRDNQITTSTFHNNAFYLQMNNGSVFCHTCTRTVLTMYDEDLTMFNNGSARFNTTMVDSLFVFREDNSTYLCLRATKTPEATHVSKHSDTINKIREYQKWLTLVLCIISIIFLVMFFIAFCFIKRMRNLPGSTIAGNMLMFLFAYVLFLARGLHEYLPSEAACYVMAVLVNYFFISAFVFMIIYAVLIIRSLEFVDINSRYTTMAVAKIWIAGLVLPFAVIIPALLLDQYLRDSTWSPGYGGKYCFMQHREGNIIFFTVPIGVCLLISLVIYGIVVHRLRQIAAATSRVRDSHREKVYLCFKLIVVLGFNWISAVLAAAVNRDDYPIASEILVTIFIVLCCLHGFFGFVVFVASGSNLQLMKDKYTKLKDSSASSNSNSGGRAVRTYSAGNNSSTVTGASELSTMIRKTSPKASPAATPKLSEEHKDYSSIDGRLSPNVDSNVGEEKHNESPVSTRSTGSKNKCDFF